MNFLADESCDFAVVQALRVNGYEVIAIAEISPRISDEEVLALARNSKRVLITEDKDFGELVYADQQHTYGVVLLRFRGDARASMVQSMLHAIRLLGDQLSERFSVIEPGRIRSRNH